MGSHYESRDIGIALSLCWDVRRARNRPARPIRYVRDVPRWVSHAQVSACAIEAEPVPGERLSRRYATQPPQTHTARRTRRPPRSPPRTDSLGRRRRGSRSRGTGARAAGQRLRTGRRSRRDRRPRGDGARTAPSRAGRIPRATALLPLELHAGVLAARARRAGSLADALAAVPVRRPSTRTPHRRVRPRRDRLDLSRRHGSARAPAAHRRRQLPDRRDNHRSHRTLLLGAARDRHAPRHVRRVDALGRAHRRAGQRAARAPADLRRVPAAPLSPGGAPRARPARGGPTRRGIRRGLGRGRRRGRRARALPGGRGQRDRVPSGLQRAVARAAEHDIRRRAAHTRLRVHRPDAAAARRGRCARALHRRGHLPGGEGHRHTRGLLRPARRPRPPEHPRDGRARAAAARERHRRAARARAGELRRGALRARRRSRSEPRAHRAHGGRRDGAVARGTRGRPSRGGRHRARRSPARAADSRRGA